MNSQQSLPEWIRRGLSFCRLLVGKTDFLSQVWLFFHLV